MSVAGTGGSDPATPSTTVRRKHDRQSYDPAVLDDVLADGVIAHVGFVRDGHPVVLPYLYAVGDLGDGAGRSLILHGSTGGGFFLDAGAEGIQVSVAITHLDGFVFARSLNDSSANYRSAVLFGRVTPIPRELRMRAMHIVGDHLMPGRRAEVREITAKELAATQVLTMPLDAVSVKVRFAGTGASADDGEDHDVWAGVLPVALTAQAPLTDAVTTDGTAASSAMEALARDLDARAAARRGRLVEQEAAAEAVS